MSTITIDRNGVSQSFATLTRAQDETVFINTTEHSNGTPSTLSIRRKLPDFNSPTAVHRVFTNRKRYVTVDAGTDLERKVQVWIKTEMSIPVGVSEADFSTVVEDTVGLLESTEYGEAILVGNLPA